MTKKRAKQNNERAEKPASDDSVDDVAAVVQNFSDAELYHNSYLSRSTIKRLREGKTRYPQHMTMKGILAAAGFEYVIRRRRK